MLFLDVRVASVALLLSCVSGLSAQDIQSTAPVTTVPRLVRVSDTFHSANAFPAGLRVKGYLAYDMSPNDPYVVADSASGDTIVVAINMKHPHIRQLVGAEGFLNYSRYCVYDAVAEWQARKRTQATDPDTMKLLKDRLLRVSMLIEMHTPTEAAPLA